MFKGLFIAALSTLGLHHFVVCDAPGRVLAKHKLYRPTTSHALLSRHLHGLRMALGLGKPLVTFQQNQNGVL